MCRVHEPVILAIFVVFVWNGAMAVEQIWTVTDSDKRRRIVLNKCCIRVTRNVQD